MRMRVDPACYTLAAGFIEDGPGAEESRNALAAEIQETVDDWLRAMGARRPLSERVAATHK
jgi:hypothetical protein